MATGYPSEIGRLVAARRRFLRDCSGMLFPAWGRYAPPGAPDKLSSMPERVWVDLQRDGQDAESFCKLIEHVLVERYYQRETCRKYVAFLREFLEWLYVPPAKVNTKQVRCYISILRKEGMSNAGISLRISALRTIFDRICDHRVTTGIELPEPTARDIHELTQSQLSVLFEKGDFRERLLLICLNVLKLNMTEIQGLCAGDIEIGAKIVNVWSGPGRAVRQVSLPDEVCGIFKAAHEAAASPEEYVFRSRTPSKPLSWRSLQNMLARLRERTNLDWITSATLRKATAIDLQCLGHMESPSARRAEANDISTSAFIPNMLIDDVGQKIHIEVGVPRWRYGRQESTAVVSVTGATGLHVELPRVKILRGGRSGVKTYAPPADRLACAVCWLSRADQRLFLQSDARQAICRLVEAAFSKKRDGSQKPAGRIGRKWRSTHVTTIRQTFVFLTRNIA